MKQTTVVKLLAGGTACALALSTAFAQEGAPTAATGAGTGTNRVVITTGSTTLNGTGTVAAYTPGTDYITFLTEASGDPIKYYYTKSTTVVDPTGKTVDWAMLKPNMPVTYTYVQDGDRRVITNLRLTLPITSYKKETTTTTTTAP
jgi:hypothetical protein